MNIRNLIFVVILISANLVFTMSMSPYTVLKVSQTASNQQIQKQYKKLRSMNRKSRTKKYIIRQAYEQILFQRQFKVKQQVQIAQPAKTITNHIDESYFYGYKLPSQYDDGRYFRSTFNETQFVIDRMNNSEANKKTARFILLLGSILLKIAPCIILLCLCRRGGSGLQEALYRARSGYANIGRRGNRQ